ncbi:MAG: uracil-DNA glycosylase [Zoogloeaceae bacterium]|jgi:DNA polymerase|nr:uracil-DNA glycosylase [Zoogloeaceae bacterium]
MPTPSQQAILQEMGYTFWRFRDQGSGSRKQTAEEVAPPVEEASAVPVVEPAPVARPVAAPTVPLEDAPLHNDRAAAIARMGWDELTRAVRECSACALCERRRQAVPGVGDTAADWLFIGEGPGEQEDIKGEPFVGQAGKLLDAMLAAIGLARGHNVYIANAVKCRPENNRTPHAEEMAACRPFLLRQIALLQPKLIVLLGKAAVHSVLDDDQALAKLRRQPLHFGQIPVAVTYHPAYLLRNLPEKARAWEDLCRAKKLVEAG